MSEPLLRALRPMGRMMPGASSMQDLVRPALLGERSATAQAGAPLAPNESAMQRAGSFDGDLRDLPIVLQRRERPEREGPDPRPVRLPGTTVEDQPRVESGPGSIAPATIANFDGLDYQTFGAGHPLDVNGDVRIGLNGSLDGCLEDRGAAVIAGTCSSDLRLKTDVVAFPSMLDRVAQLRPVTFRWRAEEFPDRHFGTERTFGLIAQEAEAVVPELVVTRPDGYKAVNYSRIPLVTLQAVRELAAENETLRASLRNLQADLTAIREVVDSLRADLAARR